jgi:chemotaxis protein methyltransferase CheR
LKYEADEEEITHVVDALTTNFTHFLREESHFQFLVKQALPSLLKPGQKQFRIWSAACATGEEPYSLAIYLAEHYPIIEGWDWQIMATDISTKALDAARTAIYSASKLDSLPSEWIRKYFQRGHNEWEGHCRVKQALTSRITFKHLNLLGDYRLSETFEVIFCRNVMIYFDRLTQQQLVSHLGTHLVSSGYLLVGHSESLNGLTLPFKCVKPSIYQHK